MKNDTAPMVLVSYSPMIPIPVAHQEWIRDNLPEADDDFGFYFYDGFEELDKEQQESIPTMLRATLDLLYVLNGRKTLELTFY